MNKTTLYLDADTMVRLKELARARGRRQSELIREAIAAYLAGEQVPAPQGVGAYRSGRSDVSERAEELLAQRPRPGR